MSSTYAPRLALIWLLCTPASAQVDVTIGAQEANVFPPDFATELGDVVAIDNDIVLFGMPGGVVNGVLFPSVFVLEREGVFWNQTDRLFQNDSNHASGFGFSLDVEGDTIVAGAPLDGNSDHGAVYVFARSGTEWNQQQKLTPDGLRVFDYLGNGVALSGDFLLAGAPGDDEAGFTQLFDDTGAAYIFERSAGTWSVAEFLVPPELEPGDRFGESVELSGDIAIVTAPGDDDFGTDAGAIYIFHRNGASWVREAKLLFGLAPFVERSIDFDGTRLAVGSENLGNVRIFTRASGAWSLEDTLTSPFAGFPHDVTIDVDRCVASNPDAPLGSRATVFGRDGSQWEVRGYFDATAQGLRNVAIDGGRVATGANDRGLVFRLEDHDHQPTCFGNNNTTWGCIECRCGNTAPTSLLGGCLNEASKSCVLSGSGSSSLTSDELRFTSRDGVPGSFGVLVSGSVPLPLNPTPSCDPPSGAQSIFLDGLRCVGGTVRRHGTRAFDANGTIGLTNAGWGTPDGPSAGLLAQTGAIAGDTLYFQLFYRDSPFQGCGTGQNTSNAVIVEVLP